MVHSGQVLNAQKRPTNDTVKPKDLRKQGYIPGIIFGKGIASIPFKVEKKALLKFLPSAGSMFEVSVEGTRHLVNLDSIDRNHMGNEIMHLSCHKLVKGQKTHVHVPIVLKGTAKGIAGGGIVRQMLEEIELIGAPEHLPDHVEIDVTNMDVHDAYHLSDIKLPAHVTCRGDMDQVIVNCNLPRIEKVAEPVETEVTAEATAETEAATPVEAPQKKAS